MDTAGSPRHGSPPGSSSGNILRRISDKQPEFDTDPTMWPRVESMERKYPQVATMIPRLREGPLITIPAATVFVHGTISCGLACLKDLYPGPADRPPEPTFRYEHDTFKPLHENGSDLGERILERLRVDLLILVAHSRGGLVARCARTHLESRGYAGEIHLVTAGTPHRGTPIVKMASNVMNMFLKFGDEVLGAVPVASPIVKAYSILWDAPTLPRGIAAMEEDSDAIGARIYDRPDRVQSWGSDFDIATSAPGFSFDFDGALAGSCTTDSTTS